MTSNKGTYWECRLCRCSWSGSIDLEEMREHYAEEHPEVDQDHLIEENDYMQKKVLSGLTRQAKKKKREP